MVVAHFFESAATRLRGAESRAHRYGRRSSLASTGYIAAIDEKAGGATWLGPGVQVPQREPHCPRNSSRAEVREAQGRVILLERGWIEPSCAAGDRL